MIADEGEEWVGFFEGLQGCARVFYFAVLVVVVLIALATWRWLTSSS